jgi:ATP adenylyltransferase
VERLWTPWRMQYVSGSGEPSEECLFCELPKRQDDAENLLLQRGRHAFSLLNLFPYNTGHVMVAPYQHTGDLANLAPEVGAELLALTQRMVAALSAEYRPDGYNLGMNLGRVAGAGIPDHLHLHIVPRWNGDTNFMPLTADTRVLPETLRQTYDRLKRVL